MRSRQMTYPLENVARCFFVVLAMCLGSFPSFANENSFMGTWQGGDSASMAIYGRLRISESRIVWGGHSKQHPTCRAVYTLEHEESGTRFADQSGHVYITESDSKFRSYLLKIKGGKCAAGISHLRLTLDDESTNLLAMVEYNGLRQPVGFMHFFRQ